MEIILDSESQAYSDEQWQTRLPTWFLDTFATYTREEIEEILQDRTRWDEMGWMLGSWTLRIQERDWQWCNLERKESIFSIKVIVKRHPYAIATLEHLLTSAGGKIISHE